MDGNEEDHHPSILGTTRRSYRSSLSARVSSQGSDLHHSSLTPPSEMSERSVLDGGGQTLVPPGPVQTIGIARSSGNAIV